MPKYKKMEDRDLRDRWIAALRSGKYGQTTSTLRGTTPSYLRPPNFENNFCCLGVLCDVVDPNGWDITNDTHVHPLAGWGTRSELLRYADSPLTPKTQTKLAEMNDDGDSFDDIANWIEKNL